MFIPFSNIKFYQLSSIILMTSTVLITFYCLIIIPAKVQLKQITFIKENLKLGAFVTTHNGLQGVVILVLANTVVIEQKDGSKTEILISTIKDINEK